MAGRSNIVILREVVNQSTYINLLRGLFRENDLPSDPIFQDDNAPAHRAAAVQRFKEENSIRSLPWPSSSPDLNPIEHVWDEMGRRLNQRPQVASTFEQLEQWVTEEWRQIQQSFIDHLVESMTRRVGAVIEARGRNTRY